MERVNTYKLAIKLALASAAALGTLATSATAYAAPSASPTAPPTVSPTPISISDLRAQALKEIGMRLDTITKLTSAVNGSKYVTADHKQALLAILGRDQTGLTNLKQDVTGAATDKQIKTDMRQMVDNYRIYALVTPQVYEVLTADQEANAEAKVETAADKLHNAINAAELTADQRTDLNNTLADMLNKVHDAEATSRQVPGEVLSLTPEGYPGNESVLKTARGQLETARDDLKAAIADAHHIMDVLKSAKATAVASPVASPSATA